MNDAVITLNGLEKRFPGMDKPAVAPLDCTIHAGYVTGLVGPDGAGKTTLMLPLKGVSMIDVEGQPFYDAEADKVLFDTLRTELEGSNVEIVELDTDINDKEFAVAAAKKLISLL